MEENYTKPDLTKEVERLMDEEGFDFGEAVKEAMANGYKNGGLMVAIQRLNQGGMAGNKTYHQVRDQFMPMDFESMGYANGGGVGSMMQPKKNKEIQGGVENYSPSEMVTVPKFAKSAPDHPQTELAYITKPEIDLIIKKDFHGSLKDGPNKGPGGLMSLNAGFNEPGGFQSGGNQSAAESGDKGAFGGGAENRARASAVRSAAINAGAGQNVNAGFFGDKYNDTVTQAEISRAQAARNNPNNPFSKEAYNRTRGFKSTGLGSFLSNINPFSAIAGLLGGPLAGLLTSGLTGLTGLKDKFSDTFGDLTGKMRGINPVTGKPNTQTEYEEMVNNRRNIGRLDSLYDNKLSGKGFSQKNIDMLESQGYSTSPGNINSAINRDLELNPEMSQFSRSYLNSVAKNLPNQTMTPLSKSNVIGFNEDIDVGYDDPAFENDLMAGLTRMQKMGLKAKKNNVKKGLMSPQEALDSISPFNDKEDPATLEEVKEYYGIA